MAKNQNLGKNKQKIEEKNRNKQEKKKCQKNLGRRSFWAKKIIFKAEIGAEIAKNEQKTKKW